MYFNVFFFPNKISVSIICCIDKVQDSSVSAFRSQDGADMFRITGITQWIDSEINLQWGERGRLSRSHWKNTVTRSQGYVQCHPISHPSVEIYSKPPYLILKAETSYSVTWYVRLTGFEHWYNFIYHNRPRYPFSTFNFQHVLAFLKPAVRQ